MTFTTLAIAALCLWLALHPFTTYPLSLATLARRLAKKGVAADATTPNCVPLTFAICTCAYNEERVIEAKIGNLLDLKSRHPAIQILIYVDAASDGTARFCRKYVDQLTLHIADTRHGKTHGMNLLVGRSVADIVVFTDANVMLAPDALERLSEHFSDPGVGCVCGNLTYVNADASVTANSGALYWRLEEGIKRLETLTGSVIGADGSLFAIRRSLHRAPPDHIIDDLYVSLVVLCEGGRVVQATDVRAYEESVSVPAEEFQRKVRIACQAFNVHRLLWPRLRRLDALTLYKYVSHKLLRWFSIYLMAASLFFGIAASASAGSWILAALLVLLPLFLWLFGSLWPMRPVSQIYDILTAFAGTGLGVWRSLQGDRFQTWAPAASLRK